MSKQPKIIWLKIQKMRWASCQKCTTDFSVISETTLKKLLYIEFNVERCSILRKGNSILRKDIAIIANGVQQKFGASFCICCHHGASHRAIASSLFGKERSKNKCDCASTPDCKFLWVEWNLLECMGVFYIPNAAIMGVQYSSEVEMGFNWSTESAMAAMHPLQL